VQPAPATTPPARENHELAYDPIRKVTVMAGGYNAFGAIVGGGDTWEWDGTTWTLKFSGGPIQRKGFKMFFNPDAAKTLVYGRPGTTNDDLWEWNGTSWVQRNIDNATPERYGAAACYDNAHHDIVVFGGKNDSGIVLGGTEIVRYRPNQTPEACTDSEIDYDNDGNKGCADDECWSVCDPLTPPGTTRPAGAPYCGDGTCNGLEDYKLCPTDCTPPAGLCGDFHCDTGETTTSCPNDC
jgi:hypothetical protein